ncbi:RluA family pseudouridine synthase [Nocardia sp. NPDC050697]|uniref:RluA family pseudouridine synthase n=1 Tax=Nocardia sp. NPDC050697 TaxID=3155158 RepID=UPI00340A8A5E
MAADWATLRRTCLLFEDDAVLALNKPAGISVTGERHDTDLVELAQAAGETLYPVHRIDKVTSGLVLLARELAAHGPLTRQFAARTAVKSYLAVVTGAELPDDGVIELPLGIGRKNRVRIAAPREAIKRSGDRWSVDDKDVLPGKNYPSTTHFRTVQRQGERALLAIRPITGRRHQIRVHFAWIGHALVGDPLFDKSGTEPRTALHSWKLRLEHDPEPLDLTADPGPDFWATLPGADPEQALRGGT